MIPVILSGGVGSRLWPMSRGSYPKQLLPLLGGDKTMLQHTVSRVSEATDIDKLVVVCNEAHRFTVAEQLDVSANPDYSIILEPQGKNTAPAIALAAMHIIKNHSDDNMLVMPADHLIKNEVSFHRALLIADNLADKGKLVTFGIKPASPETGYGYIRCGEPLADNAYTVAEFKEKPNASVAQSYLDSGDYHWNSGIFVFKASVYLEELKLHAPEIYSACEKAYAASQFDLDFIRVDADEFANSPSDSVDYAVLEVTSKSAIVPIDVGWSDIGSWSALWEVSDLDDNLNASFGDVITHDTKNSYLYSENRLVAAVGVDNLVLIDTDDAILVADKNKVADVKHIVKSLKDSDRSQVEHHRKVHRPWGWYDSLDFGERFQVKRIQVKPGAKLSVQMHYHRAEHWVVVSGIAEVRNGDETFILKENESTYIPIGETHSLHNPSATLPLEIIEVQSGSYLGEDDIVRFEDNYGRS